MELTTRDKRALGILGAAVVVIGVWYLQQGSKAATLAVTGDTVPMAEKRLQKLREIAATVPGKMEVLKQVDAELAAREKGIIIADTAPQAQASLLEVARKIGKTNGIDVRGGELGQARPIGSDYGEVSAGITFDCRIDQFVNFMADLSHEPGLIEPGDLRMNPQNPKDKTVVVRMTLTGLVLKKLVPEKKGLAAF